MGLGFRISKHVDPGWSYGGFHRFRKRLAESIGINLEEMEGFSKYGKSWSDITDPIKYFLMHSDCDGYIEAEDCKCIYPRLIEIVSQWDGTDITWEYDIKTAMKLAEVMEECASTSAILEFC